MASKFTIEVDGFRELRGALKRLGPEGKIAVKQVHKVGADMVFRTALPRVPVRTGKLKSTLRVATTVSYGAVRVGGKRSAPYAGPIHFGWPNRPQPNREWFGGPIRPNPFLYDALDRRRNEVENAFFIGINKAAKKAGLL